MKSRPILGLALLFMWTILPAAACMISNQSLTPEEQACCKSMGGNCGEMGNHSCCDKIQSGTQAAVITTSVSEGIYVSLEIFPSSSLNLVGLRVPLRTTAFTASSPPAPPAIATVLRI